MSTESHSVPVVASDLPVAPAPSAPAVRSGKAPSKRRRHVSREGFGPAAYKRIMAKCGIKRKSKDVTSTALPSFGDQFIEKIFKSSAWYTELGGNKVIRVKDVVAGCGLQIGDY